MLRFLENKNVIKLNLFLLIFCYFIPSNFSKIFNGLPILTNLNLIILFFIFPLILFKLDLLKTKFISFLIFFIAVIKIFLIFLPVNGISHNLYFIDNEDKKFIKTYNTFWNEKYSAVQKEHWNKKENFPIDWLASTDKIFNSSDPYYYYTINDYKNIDLEFKSEFLLLIHEKSQLKLNIKSEKLQSLIIKDMKSHENITTQKNEIELSKGIYLIKANYFQFGEDYKFSPTIVRKNTSKEINIFSQNLVFLPNETISLNEQFFFNFLGNIYEIITIILVLYIISKLLIYIYKSKNLLNSIIIINLLTFCFAYLIPNIIENEKILIYKLNLSFSLSLIVFTLFFLILNSQTLEKNFNFKPPIIKKDIDYFLILILPLAIIGFIRFYEEINGVSWWIPGSDGHTYQKFAREIVVDGNWLHPNTIYRQAPMYIYAFLHIIFGQSSFPQKIIEFYLVGFICFLTFKIIFDIVYNKGFAFFLSLVLLIIFTGEKYTTFIGKGYTEYYAAFLILFSLYLIRKYELNFFLFLILFVFAVIGLGLREDHIFIIFAIIFYSNSLIKSDKKNLYLIFYETVKINFKKIFIYSLLIIFSFFLLYLRNYYADPNLIDKIVNHPNLFSLLDVLNHPSLTSKNNTVSSYINETIFHSYYRMFFGSVPFEIPRLTTLILLPGFLFVIYFLIRPKKFNHITLASILSILGILFPYIFLVNHGYEPRFTIHYLPFCLILFADYFKKKLINRNFFAKF